MVLFRFEWKNGPKGFFRVLRNETFFGSWTFLCWLSFSFLVCFILLKFLALLVSFSLALFLLLALPMPEKKLTAESDYHKENDRRPKATLLNTKRAMENVKADCLLEKKSDEIMSIHQLKIVVSLSSPDKHNGMTCWRQEATTMTNRTGKQKTRRWKDEWMIHRERWLSLECCLSSSNPVFHWQL